MASIRRAALKRRGIDQPVKFTEFLSKVFREERLRRNIAMRTVAANSGMSVSFVCDFENTARGIGVDSWVLVCDAVGLDPSQAFTKAYRQFLDSESFGG